MAQISRFFDGPQYGAQDFAEFFTNFLSTGFFQGLEVEANNTMQVTLKPGSAFIEGYEYRNTSDLLLTHELADTTYNRIDRIVIRLDRTPDAQQQMTALVRHGTPSDNPEPPELVRNEAVYEISLAQVTVEAGKSYIERYQIKDERGDIKVCGRVTQPQRLTNQIDAIDIKSVDTPPEQYAEGISQFYVSGSAHPEIMQGWLDSIGVQASDYGRQLSALRAYVVTIGNKTNTGIQIFTLFAWDFTSNYRIFGEWKRANNAINPDVSWGRWQENVFIVEQGKNANGKYVRYSDGTQECFFEDSNVITPTDSTNNIHYANKVFTFPASFIEQPIVSPVVRRTNFAQWAGLRDVTNNSCDLYLFSVNQGATGHLGYVAKGRWR